MDNEIELGGRKCKYEGCPKIMGGINDYCYRHYYQRGRDQETRPKIDYYNVRGSLKGQNPWKKRK